MAEVEHGVARSWTGFTCGRPGTSAGVWDVQVVRLLVLPEGGASRHRSRPRRGWRASPLLWLLRRPLRAVASRGGWVAAAPTLCVFLGAARPASRRRPLSV